MQIIIYRRTAWNSKIAFEYLYDKLSDLYSDDVITCNNRTVIKIGDDIRIDFRCGDVFRLSGLRPDYYNTDSHPASDFLWMSAEKAGGKELIDLNDVYKVVEEHYKKEA